VKTNISPKELVNFGVFMIVGYISVLLFIDENPVARNYVGWFYIALTTIYISL